MLLVKQDPLKVAGVLGDPTRYAIYEYVLRAGRAAVTAQDVAEQFSLHPNVARTHLNKLVAVGLLASHPEKSGRGGRPVHTYTATGTAVSVTVPNREYELLANLLAEALVLAGPEGLRALAAVGRNMGEQLAAEAAGSAGLNPLWASEDDLLAVAARALTLHGIGVEAVREDGRPRLVLRNCGFREVALRHPRPVCQLCEAMVQGVMATLFAVRGVAVTASLPRGDRECVYEAPHFRVELEPGAR